MVNPVDVSTEYIPRLNAVVAFRVTQPERDLLKGFAESERVSLSDFLRQTVAKEIERKIGIDSEARP